MRSVYCAIWIMSFFRLAKQQVYEPPFVRNPDRANVVYFKEENNVTLRCKADGKPIPSYEWTFNGKIIRNQRNITVDTKTGILRIIRITGREEGVYECRASNVMGGNRAVSVSYPQRLKKISVKGFETNIVKTQKGKEYGFARLPCRRHEVIVAPKINISWYNNQDKKQLALDNGRHYVSRDGALNFVYLKRSDELPGKVSYACGIGIAALSSIPISSRTLLTVKEEDSPSAIKPNLIIKNTGLQASLATTADLECVFSGYDPTSASKLPTIRWYDSGNVEIKGGGEKYTLKNRNRILSIAKVGEEDERTFFCQASNSAGKSDKERVDLNVTSAPVFVSAPSSVTVPQHSDAVIHCSARSLPGEVDPSPPVWTINGQPFHSSRKRNLILSGDSKTLTVRDVSKPDDILCAQCSVSNSVGRTIGSACVNVILPIEVKVDCDKCDYPAPKECSCTRWELARGDAMSFRLTTTTDPAYEDKLNREWIVHDNTYRFPGLPPHMTFSIKTGAYVLDTSGLTEKVFSSLLGDYVLRISNPYDVKNTTFTVMQKGVKPEASTAGFDMWIIGLIIGIVFLLVIIIIIVVAFVNRKKQEGVYNLGKKETTAGLDPEKDLENRTFSALSRPELDDDSEFHDEDMAHAADDALSDRRRLRNADVGGSVTDV